MRINNDELNELSLSLETLDKKNDPAATDALKKEKIQELKELYWKLKNNELMMMGCITEEFKPKLN